MVKNIRTVGDDVGNLLLCKNNGKRITVSLKLVAEKRYRRLGVINPKARSIDIKRDSHLHLMHKINGYGFNFKLLDEAKLFDTIRLKDENSEWVIPKQFILQNGKYLNFAQQGFELQIFITLQQVEQFKKPNKF